MLNMIKNFAKNESGAVTIDWVILTAGVVVLGIASYNIVKGITDSLATNTVTEMEGFNCSLFGNCG
jgi:Flp pilus assembly pilin Flp